jgi:hypothetical protein
MTGGTTRKRGYFQNRYTVCLPPPPSIQQGELRAKGFVLFFLRCFFRPRGPDPRISRWLLWSPSDFKSRLPFWSPSDQKCQCSYYGRPQTSDSKFRLGSPNGNGAQMTGGTPRKRRYFQNPSIVCLPPPPSIQPGDLRAKVFFFFFFFFFWHRRPDPKISKSVLWSPSDFGSEIQPRAPKWAWSPNQMGARMKTAPK